MCRNEIPLALQSRSWKGSVHNVTLLVGPRRATSAAKKAQNSQPPLDHTQPSCEEHSCTPPEEWGCIKARIWCRNLRRVRGRLEANQIGGGCSTRRFKGLHASWSWSFWSLARCRSSRNVTGIVGDLGIVKREVKCTQEGKISHNCIGYRSQNA